MERAAKAAREVAARLDAVMADLVMAAQDMKAKMPEHVEEDEP